MFGPTEEVTSRGPYYYDPLAAGVDPASCSKEALEKSLQADSSIAHGGYAKGSLMEQMMNRQAESLRKNAKTNRAIDILGRHPEFEELLELQDLIRDGDLF